MRPALKSIGTAAAHVAANVIFDRLAPAIAAGLVALAHELHFDSAKAEAERRVRQ